MRITLEMLEARGACKNQYKLFVRLFPDGVEITEELCVKHAQDLDFEWAARHLLGSPTRKAYDEAIAPHWEAYEQETALHLKAYNEAIAPHLKAYDEATAPHWKAFDEAIAPHRKAFDKAIAPHRKAFAEASAREFFRASTEALKRREQ